MWKALGRETLALGRDAVLLRRGLALNARPAPRKIKKLFDADGKKELPLVRTRLEVNDQAKQVALEAARLAGRKVGRRDSDTIRTPRRAASASTSASFDEGIFPAQEDEVFSPARNSEVARKATRPSIEENERDDDWLPPGFDIKTLPRFEKIFGWDKHNVELEKLRNAMTAARKSDDTVVLEGKRLIVDAMKAGFYPDVFIFSRLNTLLDIPFDKSRELAMYQIPYRSLKLWSDLKAHPGLMASLSRSAIESRLRSPKFTAEQDCLPITLVLDNVRIPDNLGAILRVAAAVGCKKVVALRGCVNSWQPKVMRAAAGAHFHMPVESNVPWEKIHEHVPPFPQVVLADIFRADASSEGAEALDSETLSRRLCELEEQSRQFVIDDEQFDDVELPTDESLQKKNDREVKKIVDTISQKLQERRSGYRDCSFDEEDLLQAYAALPLVSKEYVRFERYNSQQELVVVIGGETEGVSDCAKKFTHSHLGERIFIPLRNSMDSLNVASATSVILFELQKSLTQSTPNE